jgi:hypothetical protein
MYEAQKTFRPLDVLKALLAAYAAFTIAGASPAILPEGWSAAVGSLALASLLLLGFALGTPWGRRIGSPTYVGAGMLFPFVYVAIFVIVAMVLTRLDRLDALGPLSILFLAGNVGFGFHGGPDTPLEAYLISWIPNMILPIVGVALVHAWYISRSAK